MVLSVVFQDLDTVITEYWNLLLGLVTLISFLITLVTINLGRRASSSERENKERYFDYGQEALIITSLLRVSLGWFPFFKKHFRFVQLDAVEPGCNVVIYVWDMAKRIKLEKGVDWFSKFKEVGKRKEKKVQERIFLNNSQRIKERFATTDKIEIDLEIWKTCSREQIRENVETRTDEKIEKNYTLITVSVKNNAQVPILDYEIVYAIPSIKDLQLTGAKQTDTKGQTNSLQLEAKNCSVRLDIPYANISSSQKRKIGDFKDFTIRISANLEPGIAEVKFKYLTPR